MNEEQPKMKWQPGNVVQLITGSWPMTVDEYDNMATRMVRCVWFEKRPTGLAGIQSGVLPSNGQFVWSGPQYAVFSEDALARIEP